MKSIQPKSFKIVKFKHWWKSLNTYSYQTFYLILKENFTREDLLYAYLEKFNSIFLKLLPIKVLSCRIKLSETEQCDYDICYTYSYQPLTQDVGRICSLTLGIIDEEFSS